MSDGRSATPEGGDRPDLEQLRNRLDELQGSVERLGREDEAPPPAEHATPAAPQAELADPAEPFYTPPPPRAPYDHAAETPPPVEPPYEPPYAPYPAASPYDAPPEPAYAEPPPAATNGGAVEELTLANVTILDAGPFADLIELRHFEEAVTRLDTVRDVRVRRFGHQRAKVEVGMVGSYAIGSELYRLGRPMQVELGEDGEIVVDFTDVPAEPIVAEETESDAEAGAEASGAPAATESSGGEAEAVAAPDRDDDEERRG